MRIEPLGDSAFILRDLSDEPWRVAVALNKNLPAGLLEAAASYETVGLYVDPLVFDADAFSMPPIDPSTSGKTHSIPVNYNPDDSDWLEVENQLGMDFEKIIELHCSVEYACFAIGFCPGFAYLGYLPGDLCGLPRKKQPRLRVPPGSVAITGDQTAVYPLERPGGWWIIGQTPLTLVDEDFFPIEAGDKVRFVRINADEFEARRGERL